MLKKRDHRPVIILRRRDHSCLFEFEMKLGMGKYGVMITIIIIIGNQHIPTYYQRLIVSRNGSIVNKTSYLTSRSNDIFALSFSFLITSNVPLPPIVLSPI